MIRKITGSILTIMLITTMFLGAAGVVIPEPVNAVDDSGYYEVTLTIDKITFGDGVDKTNYLSQFKFKVNSTEGDWVVTTGGRDRISTIKVNEKPTSMECTIDIYELNIPRTFGLVVSLDGDDIVKHSDVAYIPDAPTWQCWYSYTRTHYHNNHVWSYSAKDNVITANCTASHECPLEAPTLTINASDKEYNGEQATVVLTPNSTWRT